EVSLNSSEALEVSLSSSDLTPAPMTASLNAPVSLADSATGALTWSVDLVGRNSAQSRTLQIDSIEIELQLEGTELAKLSSAGNASALKVITKDLTLDSISLRSEGVNQELGQAIASGPLELHAQLTNLGNMSGQLSITLRLNWRELSSGVQGTLSEVALITLD
ncbi:MAG: hypothetical protein KDB07_10395, partial [Planctomycetes bacterium]|nr:hypothetical protein [Planctomycetota bacterium]